MQNQSSNASTEKNYSEPLKIEKENIICKDGFCSINNSNEESIIDKNDINLFDPI
tara:strand:- start:125 stop:289 length:165 start_codon:yes stop_codon:yes gene_type:complete